MKLLRETIRRIIRESLFFNTPWIKDLALFEYNHPQSVTSAKIYMLFHPELINEIIDGGSFIPELAKSRHIKGMIKTSAHNLEDEDSPCRGAWQIKLAGAQPNWGPTMYDIVMGDSPDGIIADRSSVSPEAYNVWKFYHANRTDVQKKPLDYNNVKWTAFEEDDCGWGDDGDTFFNLNPKLQNYDLGYDENPNIDHDVFLSDPLNWVYNREKVPNRDLLTNNFETARAKLENSDRLWVEKMWPKLAVAFFNQL
jgi:hypothetical protein